MLFIVGLRLVIRNGFSINSVMVGDEPAHLEHDEHERLHEAVQQPSA